MEKKEKKKTGKDSSETSSVAMTAAARQCISKIKLIHNKAEANYP